MIICTNFGTFITKRTTDTSIVIFYHFFTMQNQFWPNLVYTYKVHFWTILVLCVVFKYQYFMELFKKNLFFTVYIHISKDSNSLKNCSIEQIFFLQVKEIPIKFFVSLSKNHETKMSKNWISQRPSWILAAILDWQWIFYNILSHSIHFLDLKNVYLDTKTMCIRWVQPKI